MIPASLPITIRRGDTFRLFFRLRHKNPDGSPGAYVDLTTWGSGLGQVRKSIDDTDPMFTMTVTKANQTSYPGGILLTIPDEVTSVADFTGLDDKKVKGVWDFEIENDLGEVDTYIEGTVTFKKDVARP